ncbi:TasA family protein [Clostridium sp.]|uniref:TasA family protein n=1 Tax=Clostridium sp. TaxID=1506 RepID=UPI003217895C
MGHRIKVEDDKSGIRNSKLGSLFVLIFILASIGTALTYGYFYDSISSKADLNITTGTLDISFNSGDGTVITNPINMEGMALGEHRSSEINIANNGTLREKVEVVFEDFQCDFQGDAENDFLNNFKYELKVITDTNSYNISMGTFKDLKSEEVIMLIDSNTLKPIVLNPDEVIKVSLSIALSEDVDEIYENKGFNFSIKLRGTQVNDE